MFATAILEVVSVSWIYGVNRVCKDIEFMLGIKTGIYWRICWGITAPALMTFIFVYSLIIYKPLDYNGYIFQDYVYGIYGFFLFLLNLVQLQFAYFCFRNWVVYIAFWCNSNSNLCRNCSLQSKRKFTVRGKFKINKSKQIK